MRKTALVAAFSVSAFLVSAGASATVLVLQKSVGRHCYDAALKKDISPFAVRTCDAALESGLLSPRDEVATYVNRGVVKLNARQFDAALEDFDRALALDPEMAETYLNKGSAMLRTGGNPSDAIAMFDQALAKRMKHPELAYYNRGMAHEAVGNIKAAYSDYSQARRIAPGWNQPREELSRFRVSR